MDTKESLNEAYESAYMALWEYVNPSANGEYEMDYFRSLLRNFEVAVMWREAHNMSGILTSLNQKDGTPHE